MTINALGLVAWWLKVNPARVKIEILQRGI
jgi:hypothetical protein